ncbi:hypothetical protein AU381_22990 [Sinorhizobium glycinis]|uniref:Fido domain-containing protein n=1 Tax=Sinorhizobium glycinis TaxID=1472378 RepID=A0A178XVA4_9HYPH|nr:Fic family protein [Sinorhizobium glycinis]OAP38435.1 hypothetical protein AU381_22990 [Sinorhizobium glycinis]
MPFEQANSMSSLKLTTDLALSASTIQKTTAEQLAAAILHLEKFEGLDPQSPFGGGDGGKDILCYKNQIEFVTAVYFPKGDVSFSKTKRKFTSDLKASLAHKRRGFIFVTNQHLTPKNRKELEEIAFTNDKVCLIYHRERIRIVLDSPQGYGIRVQYLGIPMSENEQLAYFSADSDRVAIAIDANTKAIRDLTQRIGRLGSQQAKIVAESLYAVAAVMNGEATDVRSIADGIIAVSAETNESISSSLSPALICLVHRILLGELPIAGRYRASQVWLVDPVGKLAARFEPPSWDQIPSLLLKLTESWNREYDQVKTRPDDEKLLAIAKFFRELIFIHPFLDGNGRVARQLLALQCRELLNLQEDVLIDKGVPYYQALRAADDSNFDDLVSLIRKAVLSAR